MKKWKATILSLLTLTAATALSAAGLLAQKTPITAQAEDIRPTQGEQLVTPSSYEEYLSLTAPSDVAATDSYVAVADGNTLFIFDKDCNTWQSYTHSGVITKLHFGSRDQLYFLDGQTNKLYLFNAKTFDVPVDTGLVCSTFTIYSDTVYFINFSAGLTAIYRAPLSDLSARTELYAGRMYSPSLSYWNGEIYYVYGDEYLHKINLDTNLSSKVAELPLGAISIAISEGILSCATDDGGFYAYNLAELSLSASIEECAPIASYQKDYAAVSTNGNEVYLVASDRIEKFSLSDKGFDEYCIGATSSAPNRFDGASAITLAGDRLFIADDNNDRISVYDVKQNLFLTAIPCQMDNPFMASYGESLLVSTSSQAIVYSLNEATYGEEVYTLTADKISGNVVGATVVYDNYYLVTDTNYCYTLTAGTDGYLHTETLRTARFTEALTADADGNLYTLNNGTLYRYTEESFLAQKEEGVKLCEGIPSDVVEFSVAYGGNLYALSNTALYTYSPNADGQYVLQSTASFDTPLVYGASTRLASFAFGIEENAAYFLYEDNYLTVTDGLSLPTVKTIAIDRAADGIFTTEQSQYIIVNTLPNTLVVEVDGNALQGEYFSYLSYYRAAQPLTALKIGETERYALLSYRENAASPYKTLLVSKDRQTDAESKYVPMQKTGYLTNLSKVYKFPSMGLPSLGQLSKNEKVTVLGELTGLDCTYYAVAYGEQTAYIPASHIVFFDGTPPTTEEITIGDAQTNEDATWRLTYILLGTAAICILVDTLILRKKDEND